MQGRGESRESRVRDTQIRVPRARNEANQGSQGSKRSTQGFAGVEKRQTRVHRVQGHAKQGLQREKTAKQGKSTPPPKGEGSFEFITLKY